ncbi:hypothetical protein SUGI_0260860 [Cryptomeria japonica]|nr:hypothetical protein SUGI_0260860 [Cryptomeria japonica]
MRRITRQAVLIGARQCRSIGTGFSRAQQQQVEDVEGVSSIPSPSLSSPEQSLIPIGMQQRSIRSEVPYDPRSASKIQVFSKSLSLPNLLNVFADWTTSQRWNEIKDLFEEWLRTLNEMEVDYDGLVPNTASFNLVLKAMYQSREPLAAVKLIDRMIQIGQDAAPDEESYDLVIELLLLESQMDLALKYIDLTLNSGYMLSTKTFSDCVRAFLNSGKSDTVLSIIERCKAMDQNKTLCPPWTLCTYIADSAFQADNSKLACHGLEFLVRWIAQGRASRPPVLLTVEEGLLIGALGTAARTCSAPLLKTSWEILMRSLQQKRPPCAQTYLAKIHAFAALGELKWAYRALHELESAYGNAEKEDLELFSPFSSLNPLVRACSNGGFASLDAVYFQLENLSIADPPYKSVAALNCIILGCANIWDLDRAFQTFEAIEKKFDLSADVHSYNALMSAFGKMKQTFEATNVFAHMTSLGVKPNEKSYSLLVDAHVFNRDTKSALAVVNDMMTAGYTPSKDTLWKIKRRCVREFDVEGDNQVQSLCQRLSYRMTSERRREMLFGLDYSTEFV